MRENLARKVTIFCLAVLATIGQLRTGSAQEFEPDFFINETGREASELVKLCDSGDEDRLAYCIGYIAGATRLWKLRAVCESLAQQDQLFCAGVKDAHSAIEQAVEACSDCDQPEGRRRFADEIRMAGELCTKDARHTEDYCAGYNAEVENSVVQLLVFNVAGVETNFRYLGLVHGAEDIFLHAWASAEFYGFTPCIDRESGDEQMRELFLQFVRTHPEQLRNSSAVIVLEKALYYGVCPGKQQGLVPHVEGCTVWQLENDDFGTRNECGEPLSVQYIGPDGGVIERQLAPGEQLVTGQKYINRWTVCPLGHVSLPSIDQENAEAIRSSAYSCTLE